MRRFLFLACSFAMILGAHAINSSAASAQVLIWSLPEEDGTWVRFEGTYKQTQARPNNNAGDLVVEWRSELTISSVGKEMAEFDGKEAACRWIEFKTVTKPADLEKQPGPGGTYVYKVLIPKARVTGKITDSEGLPVTYIPIVKGFRKVGNRDPQEVTEKAMAVYPTVSLLTYYADLKQEGDQAEALTVPVSTDALEAQVFKGTRVFLSDPSRPTAAINAGASPTSERKPEFTSRSTNAATLWRTDAVPFGLAKFQVTVTREEKDGSASDDDFRRATLIESEMSAVAKGTDARSEIGGQ